MSAKAKRPTAERLREAALDSFARQGYEATTLSQLADAVGIQKPSLYNHMQSKQALFLSLVEEVEAGFFDELDASISRHVRGEVKQRLRGLIVDMSRFIFTATQGTFYKRYLLFPPESLVDEVRAINMHGEARIDQALRGLFEQGRDEGCWHRLTERQFLDMFYCLMDGLYSERFLYSRKEFERRLDSVWPIYWAGLLA